MATPRKKKAAREEGAAFDAKNFPHPRFDVPKDPPLSREPVAMPAGYGRPKSLQEMLATMVRDYVEMEREGDEFEDWDEANDFEPDPEEDSLLEFSPYTFSDLQEDDSLPPPTAEVEQTEKKASEPKTDAQEADGLEPQNDLPGTE